MPINYEDWTVIVVEDTYDDRQLASTILSHYGINVLIAHNGAECLDILAEVEPTLIVTDLAMPQMDGWEMLHLIRQNQATHHIPIVAVTAYDSVDVAHDAVRAGFDAYYPKPISPKTFLQNLEKLIAS